MGTNRNKLYLVVGHGPSGAVITVHNKKPAVDCIAITRRDYHAFLFCMRHIFRAITTKASGEPIIQLGDVFKNIALFLYADIVMRVAPALSEHEQLEKTALALYSSNIVMPRGYCAVQQLGSFNPARLRIPKRNFFMMNVVQKITASSSHQLLLNHALNAVENLDEIKRILDRTRPEDLPILLSAKGTATVAHLNALGTPIERTGTALQIAIYGDDEGVQRLLKDYIDPAEYQRQAKEAFSSILPLETIAALTEKKASVAEYYEATIAQQKQDAINLCADLTIAIKNANDSEFSWDFANDIPTTSSAPVIATVAHFKNVLLDYTQKKFLYNRYILKQLHDIYNDDEPWSSERCAYLLQQVIYEAQLLMSARFVQHYAAGIADIYFDKEQLNRRNFSFSASAIFGDARHALSHDREVLGVHGTPACKYDYPQHDLIVNPFYSFQVIKHKEDATRLCYTPQRRENARKRERAPSLT